MGVNIQTIKDIRPYITGQLKEIYREPELGAIARLVASHVTGLTGPYQVLSGHRKLTVSQAELLERICTELRTGKPVQYVIGETTFCDCTIRLNSSTLIPRPETEELVELIVRENMGFTGKILDIGTGSGCIAIALAKQLPSSSVTGMDISGEAIAAAKENASINSVNVNFIVSDIFGSGENNPIDAGILVSNPPYVRESEKELMNRNVTGFEPHQALFVPDEDPLVYYRRILKVADTILVPGGRVYFEINEAAGVAMEALLRENRYSGIEIVNDINNKERFAKGTKNG